jgi:RND superfamily putative drug exporter
MMNASNLDALRTLARDLAQVDGVIAVDSVWGYIPPGITSEAFATSLLIEPEMIRATSPFLTRDAALISLTAHASLDAEERRELVANLREAMPGFTGNTLTVRIGGDAGLDLDLMQHVEERAPLVIGFVIGLTWLALFVQFRSIFLPVKAILLNLMSLGASFGALVWVFQDGHLSGILGFEPTGYTVVLIPILMFCFLFGLSMDFEVIMLSRIREAWEETGDNTRAIELGLKRSAGIVTSSAAVMLVVFAAFGASELQVIKSLGVGLGIAVFIDATIIRMLLLPATMQLMGRWNWWSPVFKTRTHKTPSTPSLFRNDASVEDSSADFRNDPLSGKMLND